MSEQEKPQVGNPQEEPQEQPQAGTAEEEQPQVGTDEAVAQEEPQLDPEQLKAELRRARKEAAKYRTRLRELEQAEKERRRAEMSELERLKEDLTEAQARLAELELELTQTKLRQAVVSEAARLGFADPDDAWQLLDVAAIEVDDDGRPANVSKLLRKLAAQKPYLLRSGQPREGGQRGEGKPSPEELRRQLFGGGGGSIWEGGGYVITTKGGE